VWSQGDLFLTVHLGNTSDVPVEVPIELLRRKGPSIELVDARTGAEQQLRTHLAPDELRDRRIAIAPGQSERIEWVLHDSELTHFGRPVDLTARITLFGTMLVSGADVPFEVTTSMAIREAP
jgi:hypothetical protein